MGRVLRPKQYFWYYPGYGLYLAVKPSDPGLGLSLSEKESDIPWLLGNRFLQGYHALFDYQAKRMALYPKVYVGNKLLSVPLEDSNLQQKILGDTNIDTSNEQQKFRMWVLPKKT